MDNDDNDDDADDYDLDGDHENYDGDDDDPKKKGPAWYIWWEDVKELLHKILHPAEQEIQTRQELLSPDLNAGWRQMGQP